MSDLCAACGQSGHRYGRNEGMERFDPMACINILRGELADQSAAARRLLEAEKEQRKLERRLRVQLRIYGHEHGLAHALENAELLLVPRLLVDPQEGESE